MNGAALHFISSFTQIASTNPTHAYSGGLSQRHQYHTGLRISICINQGVHGELQRRGISKALQHGVESIVSS